ncbi:hypothetical protein B0H14DRAFT_3890772 [Mycena olivaceomarginata]|nr:hypothetical protein B0H14DRAFT_3890772 [Mycena olivaceomarginata]
MVDQKFLNNFAQRESPLPATPGSYTPPLLSSRDRAQRSSPSRSFLLLETNGINSSRTPCTTDAAIASLKPSVSSAQIEFPRIRPDKSARDQDHCRGIFGERRLDILVLKGGWGELQACNGTGHFALDLLLHRKIPSLPDAYGRVVTLSSEGHRAATAMDRHWNSKSRASLGSIYALEHILLANELQCRLAGTGICSCLSVHPGLVVTNGTHVLPMARAVLLPREIRVVEPLTGARTQLYAATTFEVEDRFESGVPRRTPRFGRFVKKW